MTSDVRDDEPSREPTSRLACSISAIVQSDGDFPTSVPGLSLHRREQPTAPLHCVYSLGLAVVAQGAKRVLCGDAIFEYRERQQCMLATIDLPVVAHVTEATPQRPFLGMLVTFDTHEIVAAASALAPRTLPPRGSNRSLSLEVLDEGLLNALTRLVNLLHEPALASEIAPLIRQEMVIRLLCGPNGDQLRQLVQEGSPKHNISSAISWMKAHFTQPFAIDELAKSVHMSPSAFRYHFGALTGTSPLQFQKQLRLQKARLLMLNEQVDAAHASFSVGYESPSQFSREYKRLFGAPPQRDISQLRKADPFAYANVTRSTGQTPQRLTQ